MKNKTTLIWVGTIAIGSLLGYAIYKMTYKKPVVKDDASTDEVLDTTPTPEPAKSNPFTAMLNNPFPDTIQFKPNAMGQYFK